MKSQRLLLAAVALALATTVQAQVKVGSNPGSISANAVLDVEGTSGSRTVVLQNGNMGVGIAAPTNNLHVSGANAYGLLKLQSSNGTSEVQFLNNTGNPWYVGKNSGSGGSDNMSFSYNALTPVATMTSSGSLGVGTVAPISRFSIVNDGGGNGTADDMEISSFGSSVSPGLIFKAAAGTAASPANLANGTAIGSVIFQGRYNGGSGFLSAIGVSYAGNGTTALSNMVFTASGAEQMRITETGLVGIGTSTPVSKLNVVGEGSNNYTATFYNPSGGGIISNVATGNYAYTIQSNGTTVGNVVANASSTTYGTTSDVRLKENIKATHYSLADLMKIQVKDYNYKTDPKKEAQTGFLAQQLYTVFPNAVSVGGEDAAKNPWNVDYGKVTPLLVKSIQDQQVQIEALKKKNQALEAQVSDVASLRSELEAIKALVLRGSPAQKATTVTKR